MKIKNKINTMRIRNAFNIVAAGSAGGAAFLTSFYTGLQTAQDKFINNNNLPLGLVVMAGGVFIGIYLSTRVTTAALNYLEGKKAPAVS